MDLFTHAEQYPNAPGYRDRDTSREAAASIDNPASLRARCLTALSDGPLTADEVAAKVGLTILTARPRMTELKEMGRIRDTGERRRNDSGRRAKVWGLA